MSEHKAPGAISSDTLYDTLKWFATSILPGLSALYAGLGVLWGFPNIEQIVGTIAAVNVFLGLIVQRSSSQYKKSDAGYDGEVVITPSEDGDSFRLVLETPLDEAKEKGYISFKVPEQGPSQ